MKHLTALLIKALFFTFILYITMVIFFGLSPSSVLFLSPVLVIGSYLLGDLFILKVAGSFYGVIMDFTLVLIVLWGYGRYFTEPLYIWSLATIYSSFLIAAGEAFLHKYLLKLSKKELKQSS